MGIPRKGYGAPVIGIPDDPKAATPGELRNPVAFVRSSREPDNSTAFIQTLTKYGRAWAKVVFGQVRQLAGDNVDVGFTHRFIIRYPGWEPEIRDYVVYGKQLHKVHSFRTTGSRNEFLLVDTRAYCDIDSAPFLTDAVIVAVAPGEETTVRQQNAFWDETPDYHPVEAIGDEAETPILDGDGNTITGP